MAYATHDELREYLQQLPAGAATDTKLDTVLERATNIIDGRLGFSFSMAAAAAAKDVLAPYGQYFEIPGYLAASITTVYRVYAKGDDSEDATEAYTDYDILDDGRLFRYLGWGGYWYRITAKWGWGATAPVAIKEVCLELAVNLWLAKESGQFSDVVGVDGGGAVGYQRALTNRQRVIIDDVRAQTIGVVVA